MREILLICMGFLGTGVTLNLWYKSYETLNTILAIQRKYNMPWDSFDTTMCSVMIFLNVVCTGLAVLLWNIVIHAINIS